MGGAAVPGEGRRTIDRLLGRSPRQRRRPATSLTGAKPVGPDGQSPWSSRTTRGKGPHHRWSCSTPGARSSRSGLSRWGDKWLRWNWITWTRSPPRPSTATSSARTWCARFAGQYPVPTYVGEFLLGRYCASTDEDEIQRGAGDRRAAAPGPDRPQRRGGAVQGPRPRERVGQAHRPHHGPARRHDRLLPRHACRACNSKDVRIDDQARQRHTSGC